MIGRMLAQYRITERIGAGGMGEVYRAEDTRLGRRVAVKFLPENMTDASTRRRFQREAQLASSLNHPHILTVHDAGEVEGRQYLVTELVDGGTLREWSRRDRSWRQIVELLIGVADGLAAAHDASILHRDIKPDNILVSKSGYAKLADFGLAKLARAPGYRGADAWAHGGAHPPGLLMGTVAYMSPEQATGEPLDPRSDIFSFGVVLYELLARQRPFEGATDLEVLLAVRHHAPRPLAESRSTVPSVLCLAVEKALAERFPPIATKPCEKLVVDLRRLVRQSDASEPPGEQHRSWVMVDGSCPSGT